jgi:hypothetical protein
MNLRHLRAGATIILICGLATMVLAPLGYDLRALGVRGADWD